MILLKWRKPGEVDYMIVRGLTMGQAADACLRLRREGNEAEVDVYWF